MSAAAAHKLKQAQERLRQGDIAGARFFCEQVLQRAPRNPDALCLLGMSHLIGGEARAAVPLLEQALTAASHHGPTLEHLGLAYLMLGQFAEAERVLRTAAALPGAPASVPMRLGAALLHQGRHAEAVPELQRALRLDPQDADSHLNLGRAYAHLEDAAAARHHFETALQLSPGHADAMFNLGVLDLDRGALDDAQQWFERVIALSPEYADAMVNLGVVFQKKEQMDEAIACFRRALAVNPALPAAGSGLAHTLVLQGRHDEAREQFLATLRLAPGWLEAREGLASVCLTLGRIGEAVTQLREILRVEPANRIALAALAEALFQSGALDEAESAAQRANAIDPAAIGPYTVLAQIHHARGELDRAATVLEAGYAQTGASSLLGLHTHLLRQLCDWEKWRGAWEKMAQELERGAELGSPFSLLCEPTTARQQLAYASKWSGARFDSMGTARHAPETISSGHPRLRIGYLSADFHEHAAAYLLAEVLELHDRKQFEIFAYSYGPEDHSAMRARLRQACEHFVDIAWDPDDIAANRIRSDQIDILVDLKGYTVGARLGILGRRPCPTQVSWLGYPGTSGAAFIDYLIADGYIIPPEQEAAYSERVLRLPHCYQPNDRQRPSAEPLDRRQYGLPDAGFVFCCFNQVLKITPEVFACWMRLLGAVPHSVLWLVDDNRWATRNLGDAARGHGIAPERLIFAPKVPFAQHLARYRIADLALDTFPYTSHTTASDALWSECPLVGLCGDTFAARVSGSILTACGLPELVTHTLEDYGRLACRLAVDRQFLTDVRARLASAKTCAPLFNSAAFTRDLEQLYLRVRKSAA